MFETVATYYYDREVQSNNRTAARLSDKTLCMIAVQGEDKQYRHYDVHSLYGHSQITSTLQSVATQLFSSLYDTIAIARTHIDIRISFASVLV
jgi:hypothetical protein